MQKSQAGGSFVTMDVWKWPEISVFHDLKKGALEGACDFPSTIIGKDGLGNRVGISESKASTFVG